MSEASLRVVPRISAYLEDDKQAPPSCLVHLRLLISQHKSFGKVKL